MEQPLDSRRYIHPLADNGCDCTHIEILAEKRCAVVPPSIHDSAGLEHLGGGNFGNEDFRFLRCDSPVGTRFYERVSRHVQLVSELANGEVRV